jgi:hypothetical protein
MAAAVVRGARMIFLLSWTDEVQSNLRTFEPLPELQRDECAQRAGRLRATFLPCDSREERVRL